MCQGFAHLAPTSLENFGPTDQFKNLSTKHCWAFQLACPADDLTPLPRPGGKKSGGQAMKRWQFTPQKLIAVIGLLLEAEQEFGDEHRLSLGV